MAGKPNSNPHAHDVEDEDQKPSQTPQDQKQQEPQKQPEQSQERKGAQPATAPASSPEAATASPASSPAPRVVKPIIGSVRDPKIDFPTDAAKVLPGLPKAKAEDLMRVVNCHVIDSFKGRVKDASGAMVAYSFTKHEVVTLPKWFALLHPSRFVIKE